jgi:hypothetical protein
MVCSLAVSLILQATTKENVRTVRAWRDLPPSLKLMKFTAGVQMALDDVLTFSNPAFSGLEPRLVDILKCLHKRPDAYNVLSILDLKLLLNGRAHWVPTRTIPAGTETTFLLAIKKRLEQATALDTQELLWSTLRRTWIACTV